ncbi:MAG: extracellular solute-binding protein [Acidimicrobiales bacterium]
MISPPSMSPRRRRYRGRAPGFLALGAALIMAVGCSGGDDGQTVRVYSGRHYDVETAFLDFSEETGISVEFLTGSDAELRERIAAEGEETEADVYITVDAGNLAVAAEQGLFAPLQSDVLDEAVPAEYRDPDGQWYGLALRARTVVYNTGALTEDQVPTTYEELADPEWAGRICLRDSTNVYTQSLVASLIANDGADEALRVVTGWADNAEIMANDTLILDALAAGECEVGIANHYYLARKYEEDPAYPVGLVWAEQATRGVHVNLSGGGVTTHADDPELAQQLLEWLATDGQSTFVDGNHEYPVNPTVPAEPLIAERFGTDFVRDSLNAAEFGALNPEAVRLMDEAGYG